MAAESILQIVIKARDEASKQIEEMGSKLEETSKKAVNLSASFKAAGAIVTGVGLAGVAVLTDWTKAAAGSEKQMAQVHASLKNVQEAMATQVVTIGGHTTSTKAQTKAILEANSAIQLKISGLRLSGKGHEDEIHKLQLSVQANKEHAAAVKGSTDASAAHTTVIKKKTESLDALWEQVQKVSAATVKLGFDDEDSAAALVKNMGITKDMKQAQTMLNAEMELARAKNMDLASAAQLVDKAYVMGGASLMRQGIVVDKNAKGMDVVNAIMNKYKGTVEETNKTAEQSWANSQLALDNVKEALGARLLPIVTQISLKFTDLANRLLNLNPKILDTIVKVVAFVTAFALIAGPILVFIGFIPQIIAGFGAVSAIAAPVVLILAAVALGAYMLYTHWNEVSATFQKAKPFIDSVFQSLQNFWVSIQPQLLKVVKWLNDFITMVAKNVAAFVIDNISTFQNLWAIITGIFTFALGFIQGFIATTWGTISAITTDLWNILKGVFEMGWGAIQIVLALGMAIFTGNWKKFGEDFTKGWTNLWHGGYDIFVGWWNLIGDYLKGVVNTIVGLINGITSGINKVSGGKINIAQIPHFQDGGYVPSTGLAIVHQGEFVLSKDMLNGKKNVPASVTNTSVTKQPITIYATVNQDVDLNLMGQKLAFALRNSR